LKLSIWWLLVAAAAVRLTLAVVAAQGGLLKGL
jgi:hypothetical protein